MSHTLVCKVGNQSILLDIDSEIPGRSTKNYELWRAQTFSSKEPDTIAWIDSCMDAGDVLYDVGANIGQYSLYAARKLDGNCQVLAFEPEALNYAKLNRNILLNDLEGSVTAYCVAIADRLEFGIFYVQTFAPGAALHSWNRSETQGERLFIPENEQGMIAVPLDELPARFGLPFPNHIKIDVDGIEKKVIDGARGCLSDPRLRSVLVEVYMHRDAARHIEGAFADGFVLQNADSVDYQDGTVQNLIFVRPELAP